MMLRAMTSASMRAQLLAAVFAKDLKHVLHLKSQRMMLEGRFRALVHCKNKESCQKDLALAPQMRFHLDVC